MRTPIRHVATLIAAVVLAACSSRTIYVVPRQTPPPPPPPPRLQPLEITLARPVRGQLVVQTSRPSYVALFEIVPERGVALLAPAYAHQRTWMLAGLNWIPVSWKVQSTMYYGRPSGTAVPARWVYAIASDEPLRLPDEAFHPSYMRRVLGPAAYRGTNPYVTMRAIARAFLPAVIDEAWAEDAYALAATYASDPYRTVRIYCANRTVYEVPEEVADRSWCPVNAPAGGTIVRSAPTRPDSIVATNGQRVRRRMPETTPVRTPIDRVTEPTPPEYTPIVTDNPPRTDNVNKDVKEKEKRGNGNAYGHTDDPNVKGRGIENEKQNDPRRQPRDETPVKVPSQPDKQAEKVETRQERQEEKQLRQEQKLEDKQVRQEEKLEDKQVRQEEKLEDRQVREEQKQEQKADRQEQKAEQREEHKAEKAEQKAEKPAVVTEPPRPADPVQKQEPPAPPPEAKQDKQESKAEAKEEAKEEKSEAKAEDKPGGKPEDKAQGKPGIRPPGARNQKGKP